MFVLNIDENEKDNGLCPRMKRILQPSSWSNCIFNICLMMIMMMIMIIIMIMIMPMIMLTAMVIYSLYEFRFGFRQSMIGFDLKDRVDKDSWAEIFHFILHFNFSLHLYR